VSSTSHFSFSESVSRAPSIPGTGGMLGVDANLSLLMYLIILEENTDISIDLMLEECISTAATSNCRYRLAVKVFNAEFALNHETDYSIQSRYWINIKLKQACEE